MQKSVATQSLFVNMSKIGKDNLKVSKLVFGQLVIGPPGSGKSTYCQKMIEFYKKLGRNVELINLDPANENIEKSNISIDIMDLIKVEDVMDHLVY
jgi:GPN-loop GTPase